MMNWENILQELILCCSLTPRITACLQLPIPCPVTRRAFVEFGPHTSSPDVPSGSFVSQGTFEPTGGALQMRPVKWALQPAHYAWFGLVV